MKKNWGRTTYRIEWIYDGRASGESDRTFFSRAKAYAYANRLLEQMKELAPAPMSGIEIHKGRVGDWRTERMDTLLPWPALTRNPGSAVKGAILVRGYNTYADLDLYTLSHSKATYKGRFRYHPDGRGYVGQNIRKGLNNITWPGRLEFVGQSPRILLDGAHNLAAARNLARFLRDSLPKTNISLVAGILDDKPYKAMLLPLMKQCQRVVVTRPVIDRALEPDVLYDVAKQAVRNVRQFPNVAEAVTHAVNTAKPGEVICIAGSLYVVGEAKQALANIAGRKP